VTSDGTLSSTATGTWADLTGKPSTFSPTAHANSHAAQGGDPITIAVSQVTGLQAALDGKQAAGSYAAASHTHTASAITDFSAAVATAIPASVVLTTDSRLTDSRSPTSHAASHTAGGTDAVTLTIAQTNGLQTALDLKAPLVSPTFTGTVYGVSKAMVGLGSVDNTSDASKPVSTAQAAADAAVQAYAIQRANHTGTQAATTITGLSTVATSGAYADLSGKPSSYSLPVATASVLGGVKTGSNVTIAADGTISVAAPVTTLAYSAITGTPSLATVATSGVYADLTSKPTLGTSSSLDVAATGNATSGQVVKGNDTRLSDSRTPSSTLSHASTHGSAGTDPVSIAYTQVTGLGTLATQSGTFSGTSSGTNTGDQTVTLTGDVTGTGTGSFATTLAASGATAGTYTSVTVDAKGRVTAGTNPAGYSLPNATTSILGGITVSTGLSVTSGALSVAYGTSSTTACVGNDSRLSDSRTPTSHVHGNITNDGAIGSSSGQIVVTTTSGVLTTASSIASSAVSGLAASATTNALVADNISSGTLPDARISSTFATAASVNAGFHSGTAIDTIAKDNNIINSGQLSTSSVYYTFFTPVKSMTVSQISMACSYGASSGITLARMALVSFDETTATILARTASDTTLFNTTNTLYTRSFSTTGGYPSTYALVAGTRYGIALAITGSVTVGVYAQQLSGFQTNVLTSPRICAYGSLSSGDIPTSATSLTAWNIQVWARFS